MTADTLLFLITAFFSLLFKKKASSQIFLYLMTTELLLNLLTLFSLIIDAFFHQLHYAIILIIIFASL